jgi:hypothetical protein
MLATDPLDLLLDADGDLAIEDGDFVFARGLEGITQLCRTRLQTFRGEWFADLTEGVPYLERDGVTAAEALLGQKFNEVKARAAFRDVLLSTPGVLEVTSMTVTFDGTTRTLTVSWRVRTELGDTDLDTLEI